MPRGFEAGSAAVGVHGHLIVLAGGLRSLIPGVEGGQDTVDSVVAYDFRADVWRMMPAQARTLPEGRDHAGAAVVNGTLYIVGGRRRGQNNVRDTVFALDLTCMSTGWKVKAERMPTARGGLSAAAIGKTIYTFGGEGNPAQGSRGVFPQVEAYDTTADTWRKLSNMTTPRHGTYAVAVGGAVYIPGGGNQQGAGPVSLHEAFYP
ncbi:hypothetical protein NLG97_g6268 [Lecanicillium saksenae]|uniref:Uncharacterized protein n=1 Tax=Lecanicillium saksenae TaxID=468837 RepID=A0ACC1QSH8_9HYPO|nr:hypothetical protein NLG97_g6268 [Lecanicillium saksenae]